MLFHEGLMIQGVELTGQLVPVALQKSFAPATVQLGSIAGIGISDTHPHFKLTQDQSKLPQKIQGSSQAIILNIEQRRKNVQNVFEVHFTNLPDRVWLVDDLMTSGATLNEIARVLKKSGVTFVGSLTLARRLLES